MQLVTWNTQWCRGMDGRVDVARIVRHALSLGDVDVLCLQEIAVDFPRLPGAPGDQEAEVCALLPTGWQVFFGAAVDAWTGAGRQRFGNLIATRLPVLQLQHHLLPYPFDPQVRSSMPRLCSVLTVDHATLGPVRVMATHLEYYSHTQRMAQARRLRALHLQACAHAAQPAAGEDDGTPFQAQVHTPHAVLCGDFNLQAHDPEYAALAAQLSSEEAAGWAAAGAVPLHDAWALRHPGTPQPPTFCLYERRYAKAPIACDFVWVSDSLQGRVREVRIDGQTQASDHQPVLLSLG